MHDSQNLEEKKIYIYLLAHFWRLGDALNLAILYICKSCQKIQSSDVKRINKELITTVIKGRSKKKLNEKRRKE